MASNAQKQVEPPVGARFEFRPFRGARRVYELVESLPREQAANSGRCGSDRHAIKVVEETGFVPEASYGIGWTLFVEDLWFTNRTDARRLS